MLPMQKSVTHKVALKINAIDTDQITIEEKNHKKEVTFINHLAKYAKKIAVDQIFSRQDSFEYVNSFLLSPAPVLTWKNKFVLFLGSDQEELLDFILPQEIVQKGNQSFEASGAIVNILRRIKHEASNDSKKWKIQLKVLELSENSLFNLTQLKSRQNKIKMSLSSDQDMMEDSLNKFIEIQDQNSLISLRKHLSEVRTVENTIFFKVKITIVPSSQSKSIPQSNQILFLQFSSFLLSEGEKHLQLKNQFLWLAKYLKNINKPKTIEDFRNHSINIDKFCTYLQPFLDKIHNWQLLWVLNQQNITKFSTIAPYIEQFCLLKSDQAMIESLKKQIQKQEMIYRRVVQKNKAVLNILSKCINLQYSQIDKKVPLFLELLPANQQRSSKMRIANIRKQENEEQLQQLERQITLKEEQLVHIKQQQKKKYEELLIQKQKILEMKQKVFKQLNELKNPPLKYQVVSTTPSLYAQAAHKTRKPQKQPQNLKQHPESVLNSKGNFPSHNLVTKKKMDQISEAKTKTKALMKQNMQTAPSFDTKAKIAEGELLREIFKLLKLVHKRQEQTDKIFMSNFSQLSNKTINKYKQMRNNPGIDLNLIASCLKEEVSEANSYDQWKRDEQKCEQLLKWIRNRNQVLQTNISLKEN